MVKMAESEVKYGVRRPEMAEFNCLREVILERDV